MLQQLACSYALRYKHQESYRELVLWQPKAMRLYRQSELLSMINAAILLFFLFGKMFFGLNSYWIQYHIIAT